MFRRDSESSDASLDDELYAGDQARSYSCPSSLESQECDESVSQLGSLGYNCGFSIVMETSPKRICSDNETARNLSGGYLTETHDITEEDKLLSASNVPKCTKTDYESQYRDFLARTNQSSHNRIMGAIRTNRFAYSNG